MSDPRPDGTTAPEGAKPRNVSAAYASPSAGDGTTAPEGAKPRGVGRAAGVATIVLTLLGWSSVPLFLRHFTGSMDPWTSNGWRYGFAALLWAPVVLLGLRRRNLPRGIFRAALVPGIVNAAGQVFYTWAHYKVEPGLLSFGFRTQIVFVAIGAYALFPDERRLVRMKGFWGALGLLVLGAAGTLFLGEGPLPTASAVGFGMAVLSGALFAAYYLSVRKCMSGYPSIVSFAVISQYTAAIMVALMLLVGKDLGAAPARLPGGELSLLLLSAVIGIALGHVFYYVAIKELGVAASSGVLQVQPICVAVGSWFLFGEKLAAGQWAGGALAIAGALTILLLERRASAVGGPA